MFVRRGVRRFRMISSPLSGLAAKFFKTKRADAVDQLCRSKDRARTALDQADFPANLGPPKADLPRFPTGKDLLYVGRSNDETFHILSATKRIYSALSSKRGPCRSGFPGRTIFMQSVPSFECRRIVLIRLATASAFSVHSKNLPPHS